MYAGYADQPGAADSAATQYQPAPHTPEPPDPWYRRPAAMIGSGVITAVLLALAAWGIARLNVDDSDRPKDTPATTTAPVQTGQQTTAENPPAQSPAPAEPTAGTDAGPVQTTPSPAESSAQSPTSATTTEPPAPTTTAPPSATTTAPAATTTPDAGWRLPSEITLPSLPTKIELPPGR